MDKKLRKEIARNYNYYNLGLDVAEEYFKKDKLEEAINLTKQIAWFSRYNYCGFYSDIRMESLLLRIAHEIKVPYVDIKIKESGKKLKILHVATEIYETGGHTRGLQHWIKTDSENNQHDVLLTNGTQNIPAFFSKTIKEINSHIYLFDEQKAKIEIIHFLRNIADKYDIIILHHNPNDTVPIIALSCGHKTPIAILDHADIMPWVGSSICDCLIDLHENCIELNKLRRHIENICLVPYNLLYEKRYTTIEAREELGFKDEIVILSIGSKGKLAPTTDKNFFEDIIPVLNKHPNTKLLIVGLSPASDLSNKYAHPQIQFVEPSPDIEVYKYACDIYIDCYPKNSGGAMMEVALIGKPVLQNYSPSDFNLVFIKNYRHKLIYPENKTEWQNILELWIKEPKIRAEQGTNMHENMYENHVGENWLKYTNKFYDNILKISRTEHTIPPNTYRYTKVEEELMAVLENNGFQNIYLVKYFKYLTFKLKLRILFASRSFNLHSAKLLVFYLLGIKEKASQN